MLTFILLTVVFSFLLVCQNMVAPSSIQPVGAIHLRGCGNDYDSHIEKFSLRHSLKDFAVDVRMFAKGICSSTHCKLNVAHGSTSHALVMDEFSSTSDTTPDNNEKTSSQFISSEASFIYYIGCVVHFFHHDLIVFSFELCIFFDIDSTW
ncbi:hypothetical protein Dsin_016739 [Dipteronia sinensis]|uniref:Uncharacterized protein n=1 Tax=Dipteronia sinensis TaxID=43782 RepID=A0AAE0E791_9ROSI|nr:hypothetical protein Dsin_016739 [Dipteronia sinensis]